MKPTIIVPAYSRADSLNRLLNSINDAIYPFDDIVLIISLDGGYSKKVHDVAVNFNFLHGNKQVIKRENKLGLREHILWCGNQTKKYESVIILEDDLFVDTYFYDYTIEALKYYQNEKQIAGISLYGHKYNEYADLPFEPIDNGYSGYFMQIASSWGQAWTKQHWEKFLAWYKNNSSSLNENINLPQTLINWPSTSWKKFYSAYLVSENKYFLYPYKSYTTNCADAGGEHVKNGTNLHQVPLGLNSRKGEKYEFPVLNNTSVYYDSFMEPDYENIFKAINISRNELEIDLFGLKDIEFLNKKKFVLTSKLCKSPLARYKLNFHPIENNILFNNIVNSNETHRNGEFISLALSLNIIENKQPFFKLADFYSYVNYKSINFFKSYIQFVIHRGIKKLLKKL